MYFILYPKLRQNTRYRSNCYLVRSEEGGFGFLVSRWFREESFTDTCSVVQTGQDQQTFILLISYEESVNVNFIYVQKRGVVNNGRKKKGKGGVEDNPQGSETIVCHINLIRRFSPVIISSLKVKHIHRQISQTSRCVGGSYGSWIYHVYGRGCRVPGSLHSPLGFPTIPFSSLLFSLSFLLPLFVGTDVQGPSDGYFTIRCLTIF